MRLPVAALQLELERKESQRLAHVARLRRKVLPLLLSCTGQYVQDDVSPACAWPLLHSITSVHRVPDCAVSCRRSERLTQPAIPSAA